MSPNIDGRKKVFLSERWGGEHTHVKSSTNLVMDSALTDNPFAMKNRYWKKEGKIFEPLNSNSD